MMRKGCFAAAMVLVLLLGVWIGQSVRDYLDSRLVTDVALLHAVVITDAAAGEEHTVLDEAALEDWHTRQTAAYEKALAAGADSEEAVLAMEKVRFAESNEVRREKRAILRAFAGAQEGDITDEAAGNWRYEVEMILRDKEQILEPRVNYQDDFTVYVNETGYLWHEVRVYRIAGDALSAIGK